MKWTKWGRHTWRAKECLIYAPPVTGKRYEYRVLFSVDTNRGKGLEQVLCVGTATTLEVAKKRAEADYDRALRAWSWLRKR